MVGLLRGLWESGAAWNPRLRAIPSPQNYSSSRAGNPNVAVNPDVTDNPDVAGGHKCPPVQWCRSRPSCAAKKNHFWDFLRLRSRRKIDLSFGTALHFVRGDGFIFLNHIMEYRLLLLWAGCRVIFGKEMHFPVTAAFGTSINHSSFAAHLYNSLHHCTGRHL